MKHKLLFISFLVFSLALTGCFSILSGETTIEIKVTKNTTSIDESISLEAIIKEKGKDLAVDNNDITWELSDPTKAKLSSTNGQKVTLTALKVGTVTITASYGKIKSKSIGITITEQKVEEPQEYKLFSETFDDVSNGTNIRDNQSQLDNPDSFSRENMSGGITVNNGAMEMGSQRIALEIPGLSTASNPILKVTIKNDNGTGTPVSNLKLAVGNKFSSGGAVGADGYRAHGEYPINDSEYQVLEIELNLEHTHTGLINFRGIVGTGSTAGLFIDKIEVWDIDDYNPPVDPTNPDPSEPDPDKPNPDIPTDPPPVIGDAYFDLVGWASENGGTTGGEGCPEDKILFIDNGRDLFDALYANERRHRGDKSYGGDPYPLIIYITGKITPENTGEKKIDIKDQANVSIIGLGDQGEFDGIGISLRRASNIIIRNLTIHHVNTGDKKALDITTDSKNIWVDRCTFYSDLDHGKNYYDGLLDIKDGAEYVTVSWCKFYDHYKTSLVGHTANEGKAPNYVTYHHNYFYNVNSRTPLIRYAAVHLFNNFFEDIESSGINVRLGAEARIENNYFKNVGSGTADPYSKQIQGPIGWWYNDQPGYWHVIDNIFEDSPDDYKSTKIINVDYDYSMALNDAETAKELVLQYAGAGSPSLQQ